MSFDEVEVATLAFSMSWWFVYVFAILLGLICKCHPLVCVECDSQKCNEALRCGDAGVVKDPCNCCNICAKKAGQTCGGPWNAAGKCGRGLRCISLSAFPVSGVCVPT